MQARASLSGSNLGSKSDIVPMLVGKVADDPLGNHQLVGSILGIHGEELNLVLLIDHAINGKVTHLRVAILDLSASLSDVGHALSAELIELSIGSRLMVTLLVSSGKHTSIRSNHIILQLTHRLELHTCHRIKCTACLAQRILGRTLKRLAILVEIRTQHRECRQFGKRVNECSAEARQHIEVAATRLNKGEEAATVHALTTGEDSVEVSLVINNKVKRLQSAITCRVHKVDHTDSILLDETHNVGLCKLLTRLLQISHNLIGAH